MVRLKIVKISFAFGVARRMGSVKSSGGLSHIFIQLGAGLPLPHAVACTVPD